MIKNGHKTVINKSTIYLPKYNDTYNNQRVWRWGQEKFLREYKTELIFEKEKDGFYIYQKKRFEDGNHEKKQKNYINIDGGKDKTYLATLFDSVKVFESPKPLDLIKHLLKIGSNPNDIILDFFAGSGTTGHAVMQLNSEDGGNRKFILCQIDEPIKKDKPAYKFCKDNNLEPVISSITIERLKRAGEQIESEKLKVKNEKLKVENEGGLEFEDTPKIKDFDPLKGVGLDTGFKVFDSVNSPRLALVDENTENSPLEGWQPQVDGVDTTQTNTQVELIIPQIDALSRVYNMIFSIGLDEPTVVPEEILEDSIYKIGNNYYLTNCDNIDKEELNKVIKSAFANQGNVFIDGWTASINTTLQVYKKKIMIVF